MAISGPDNNSNMRRIQAPPNLPQLVKTAFNKARESRDLTYFPTQVTVLNVNSIPVRFLLTPQLPTSYRTN